MESGTETGIGTAPKREKENESVTESESGIKE